ncbi:MAG TPA: ATP-binding protein, partial [Chloroflexota bacterium]|nr:ATP-binding protein [Chloroflexota bacterium]
SPDGGTVEVSVARGEGSVTVSVKDDGMGIPLESQPHIFERFFRGHLGNPQDYGGLGVGLYISREIVRRLGGDMGFSSLPGEGSTFHFTLSLPA